MRTLTPLLLFGALAATATAATAATAARPAAIPAMHACTADEADRRRIADDRMETPDDAASMRGTALQEPDGTFAADLVLAQAGDVLGFETLCGQAFQLQASSLRAWTLTYQSVKSHRSQCSGSTSR